MNHIRVIDMPERVAKQPQEYREGYIAWHAGKRLDENEYSGVSVYSAVLWGAGWLDATGSQVPTSSPFYQHLKIHDKYEARGSQIIYRLIELGLIENKCPHALTFDGFCEARLTSGEISCSVSSWWVDEEYKVCSPYFPVAWMDGDFPEEQIKQFAETRIAIREKEKAEREEKEAQKQREQKLAQLAALKAEFPDA